MLNITDIAKANGIDVICLTTNMTDVPTLCEEYVESNALSVM